MRFGDPTGLWLGVAGALVLLTYLVRRRVRRVEVPFLPLWTGALTERRGGFGSAMTRWLDLLLALLACACVALAAGAPYLPGRASTVRDLVLVMDGGLELRAADRLEKLVKIAEAEVRRRAAGTRYLIVRVDSEGARLHTGTSRGQALAFVREQTPGWQRAGMDEALTLAREGARHLTRPDLVFCTYRPGRPEGFRLRTDGTEAVNVGFVGLEVLGDPEGGGRIARAVVRGRGAVEIDTAAGEGVWAGDLDGSRVLDLPLPPSGRESFTLSTERDDFAPDNAIYLSLPEKKRPRVLVVAEGDASPFLISAMEALEKTRAIRGPLDRTQPQHLEEAARAYDVVVFDRCAPARSIPGLRALYIAPEAGVLPFKLGAWTEAPTLFDVKTDDPLILGTGLERIPPVRARALLGGTPIASAAPGAVIIRAPGYVALGYDPDACVLASSPAYPLFLRAAIAFLAGAAPARESEFVVVGERAPRRGDVTLPDGSMRTIRDRVIGPPGFWSREEDTWAVNLLVPDLDLASSTERSDPVEPVGVPAVPDHPLTPAFAGAGLLFLLAGWWWYWRGRV
jgi:hypothetical protein